MCLVGAWTLNHAQRELRIPFYSKLTACQDGSLSLKPCTTVSGHGNIGHNAITRPTKFFFFFLRTIFLNPIWADDIIRNPRNVWRGSKVIKKFRHLLFLTYRKKIFLPWLRCYECFSILHTYYILFLWIKWFGNNIWYWSKPLIKSVAFFYLGVRLARFLICRFFWCPYFSISVYECNHHKRTPKTINKTNPYRPKQIRSIYQNSVRVRAWLKDRYIDRYMKRVTKNKIRILVQYKSVAHLSYLS